ncbi:RHS repeat-associated core domain-containing protein [Acinetobacter rudis]|uniref:YD repeat (Two copies) n=2 Tax=Acinetobacter rudis TaxID=632955 RepID=S3P5Y8_9GAMM|nr:RHS repeat-associated core domain-containing protein [Acinetobacter rudis]EPF74236.1 hypothetical protein F945_01603 [Acinetobacter rudis CIP 110305]
MTTTNNDQKAAVELAVFNLDSVTHLNDQQMIAHQIQRYLQICGNTSLERVQGSASVPMVANIYALTGSVLDLMLYATQPLKGDAGTQQSAMLAANLIGLFLTPQNEAHARIALRPMFGLMAECLYKKGGKLRASDLKRLELHLNAHIAGDLADFLQDTQAKLSGLLASASVLGTTILTSMSASSVGVSMGVAVSGASADKRDPKELFYNWASPLVDLLSIPSQADLSAKIDVTAASHLQVSATKALATLSNAISQQANAGQQYSLAWLLTQTLQALKDLKTQGNASVPINQTGEYERHTKGDTLEFVTLQANALNAPPCEGAAYGSGQSISYSIGAERVNHSDFYLPKLGFSFTRLYHSQLDALDNSAIGARWMTPFSSQIILGDHGLIFIDGKGRQHHLAPSLFTEAYEVPYEGITAQGLDNGQIVLSFGGDWLYTFESFNSGLIYQLVLQLNVKTDEQVVLNYLNFGGHAFLQSVDFKLKAATQSLKFAYNKQVKIIAIFVDEQAEPLARYEYDAAGNLIQAFDQNAHQRSYEYNAYHQLTRYTDRTGRGQNVRYASTLASAKAIEEWADDGSFHTRLEWHDRLRQVTVYNADHTPTQYYFDIDGFTYRIRLADGREEWYSRDAQKRITRHIDFFGRETQQEYNAQDQLSKVIQPNGGIIRFAYDEKGRLLETKDPEGNIWKQSYDSKGNVIEQIDPLERSTQFKYNDDGQVIEVIDAKGGSKTLQYNDLGQLTAFTDCSGKTSSWEYNDEGQLIAETSAEGQKLQYQYSQQGRDKGQLQAVIYPDGLKETFERDQEGRLLKHLDTQNHATQYVYSQLGLLQQRIDANQHPISYYWDRAGRLSKLVNQNRAEYQFQYNQYGQLIRERDFSGEEKQFKYSEQGLLAELQQPNIKTIFGYDEGGQLSHKQFIDVQTGLKQEQAFDYNFNQQLTRASNEHSQIQYYYNPVGQVAIEHQHYRLPNIKPVTAVLRYEYDELGNLSKTIRPDGQEHALLSYGSGHVYGVAFNGRDMVGFKRDDLHRETERFLANGLIQRSEYNDVGLLSSQHIYAEHDHPTTQYQAHRHYQYDQNYLLTQVNDSRLGQIDYQYDPVGRLVRTQGERLKESFQFDPAGNLIDATAGQHGQIKNNLIQQYQGASYRYDAQGNVIEKQHQGQSLKLYWDNLNRLSRSELNGQTTHYGYDVFGRRLFKQTQRDLTLFGWDGDLMIWESVKRNNSSQSYTKHYLYEPDSFVPLVQTGYSGFIKLLDTPDYRQYQTQAYIRDQDPLWKTDTRYKRAEIERAVFYHCDQVGTPQVLSNESGEQVWAITLDTWGQALDIKASDHLLEQTNIRFQGQYFDAETGLHYNRYRYYEPHSARYIGKDPIGLEGGINTSAYVSDPNAWVDPMGLTPWNWDGQGDTSMCKYYDDMYKRTQCPYYKDAGEICRGNNSIVNGAIKTGITASWTYGKTSASESEILNTIRKSLISGDQDFRSFNKVPYNSCLNGNAIDLYHDLAFEKAKISTVFYGGNLWPQSVWPNVVPFDPRNKSKYDIRRLFNK